MYVCTPHTLVARRPCLGLKPGFHYPSWRSELTGDRFSLPVNTGRVDGRAFPLAELTDGPCWRVMKPVTRQLGPLTWAANSGSGNRASYVNVSVPLSVWHMDSITPDQRLPSHPHTAVLQSITAALLAGIKMPDNMATCVWISTHANRVGRRG